jgi:hypothetical protein
VRVSLTGTMDSKVGIRAEGMSNLHLHVARVLRDQLDDLLTRNTEAKGIRSTLEFAAPHILVSEDSFWKISVGTQRRGLKRGFKRGPGMGQSSSGELMDPEIWKTLPSHLLHLVLAQLPVPDIKRLRFLSKEWKRSVDMPWSEFRQVCEAEARSSRFAVICPGDKDGKFLVNTFDLRTCRWHAFTYMARPGRSEVTICACDGGLVCLLLKTRERCPERWPPEECISVWNPLTGDECLLPGFDSFSPEGAVKLSVDRETKSFKVTVVSTVRRRNRGDNETQTYQVAHVYDSVTRDWEKMISSNVIMLNSHCCAGPAQREGPSDSLVGWVSPNPMEGILGGVCTYDPAEGKLKNNLHKFNQRGGKTVLRSTTFAEEHFFTLFSARDPPLYGIGQCRYNGGEYTLVKNYRFPPLDKFPQQRSSMRLDACKGFVIVSACAHLQQRRWLFDLSTGAWRDLPGLAEDMMTSHVEYVLCELQWSVLPKSRSQELRESVLKEVSERKPVQ